jgi:hypothetical protein
VVKKPAPLTKKQGAAPIEGDQQGSIKLAKPIEVVFDSLNSYQELAQVLQQVCNLFKVLVEIR